jgi:hypothetical protein
VENNQMKFKKKISKKKRSGASMFTRIERISSQSGTWKQKEQSDSLTLTNKKKKEFKHKLQFSSVWSKSEKPVNNDLYFQCQFSGSREKETQSDHKVLVDKTRVKHRAARDHLATNACFPREPQNKGPLRTVLVNS